MIKGISRQIVEVTDTANPYFERIFFVVKPQCREASPALLDFEARKVVNTATGYTGLKRARRVRLWKRWGLLAAGIGIGTCLTCAITALSR